MKCVWVCVCACIEIILHFILNNEINTVLSLCGEKNINDVMTMVCCCWQFTHKESHMHIIFCRHTNQRFKALTCWHSRDLLLLIQIYTRSTVYICIASLGRSLNLTDYWCPMSRCACEHLDRPHWHSVIQADIVHLNATMQLEISYGQNVKESASQLWHKVHHKHIYTSPPDDLNSPTTTTKMIMSYFIYFWCHILVVNMFLNMHES